MLKNFVRKRLYYLIFIIAPFAGDILGVLAPAWIPPLSLVWALVCALFALDCYFLWSFLKQREEFVSLSAICLLLFLFSFNPHDPTYYLGAPVLFLLGAQFIEAIVVIIIFLKNRSDDQLGEQARISFCTLFFCAIAYFMFTMFATI